MPAMNMIEALNDAHEIRERVLARRDGDAACRSHTRERCEILRPGYAVEYDYSPPTQLQATLETKLVPGLYFASMSQVYPWDRGTNFAVALGRAAGLSLPVAEATLAQYQRLVASGKGELDKSAIAELTFTDRVKESH